MTTEGYTLKVIKIGQLELYNHNKFHSEFCRRLYKKAWTINKI